MKQVKILSALGLMTIVGAANAGVSSTITATNDYDFRGITQTAEDPALQASLDIAQDNGWYVGAWASNVDFGSEANVELDVYTGITGKITDNTLWDIGVVYYTYPGESNLNTGEIYGSLSYMWLKGKMSYTTDVASSGDDGLYLDASVNIPLPANFSLQAHVGQSSGEAYADDILDYSAGAGYAAGNFNIALKYVDTDRDGADDGRVILTVATTFPWK
jgi:uncharacterized protein (TIGR02001 family)